MHAAHWVAVHQVRYADVVYDRRSADAAIGLARHERQECTGLKAGMLLQFSSVSVDLTAEDDGHAASDEPAVEVPQRLNHRGVAQCPISHDLSEQHVRPGPVAAKSVRELVGLQD